MFEETIEKAQQNIGVTFKEPNLLLTALVHRSYLNEHPHFELPHNERLEFLGDAVLELVVTEHLYRTYPNPEGEMTAWRSALVKTETLSKVGEELELAAMLFLSKGEEKGDGRSKQILIANAFEAVVGAVYLDQGYDAAKQFIHEKLMKELPEILEKKLYLDAKSELQELAQRREGTTPHYQVLKEEGPDHAKIFTVGVYVGETELGVGSGPAKQDAQQQAALDALSRYRVDAP